MKHDSHGLTHPGRVRTDNQDAILMDAELGVYILCDGCGGQRAGDVAARMTVEGTMEALRAGRELLADYARRPSPRKQLRVMDLVSSAIDAASEKVCAAAQSDPNMGGMGSTIALAVVLGDRVVIAHAGDSRVYLYRHGQIHRLTEDHNAAHEYVKMGLISRSKAADSRYTRMLTRAVGFHESARADTLHFELAPGDTLLLCSDGLTTHVTDKELATVCAKLPAAEVPQRLIDAANHRGGKDNISAIVVRTASGDAGRVADVIGRLQALQSVPLFGHLTFQQLLGVMDIAQVENYEPGNRIITQGEKSDQIFVSVSGVVHVVRNRRKLAELPPGSLFGEMSLIDEAPRSADVVTPKGARVMSIRREDFFGLLRREKSLGVKVLWGLCRLLNARLRSTSSKLSGIQIAAPPVAGAEGKSAKTMRPFA